jgi:hypothetical protein
LGAPANCRFRALLCARFGGDPPVQVASGVALFDIFALEELDEAERTELSKLAEDPRAARVEFDRIIAECHLDRANKLNVRS